jgi:hypothetical protein
VGSRETMTLTKYVKEFNQAPLPIEEFAEVAEQIVDCERLSAAAKDFLSAKRNFEHQLREHDVEVG